MIRPSLTLTEENYLKAIYILSERNSAHETSTNEIAARMHTKPPTVSDMLRKLNEKNLVNYSKYQPVQLTKSGKQTAIQVIRRHRLWEVFLYDKLNFSWDEVHEVAEQLEHIHSDKLMIQLDKFLGYPKTDPHGDPIPSVNGVLSQLEGISLSQVEEGKTCKVLGVKDSSTAFLQYLKQVNIQIGTKLKVLDKIPFDGSMHISMEKGQQLSVSEKFAENVLVL